MAVQLEVINSEAAAADKDRLRRVVAAGKQSFDHYDEGFRLIESFFEGAL